MFNSRPKKGSSAEIWRYLRGCDKGAEEYYLGSGESGEGEPAEGQPAGGELFGKGAERLGLSSIDRKTFSNLARGFSPDGSCQLIQTQNGKHVPGIDVSASADKSVSVAMIGASEDVRGQILACLDGAFDAALQYIEENVGLCRPPVRGPPRIGVRLVKKGPRRGEVCRTQGSDTERVPGELVVMKVRHSTARPTTEQIERGTPPDVHLHDHGFIFNMAWVADENEKDGGKWRAIDDCGIKRLRMTLEYVFQGEFARLLEDRLGLEIDYDRDLSGDIRWRLRGIDPAACEFFSTRSREIEALRREFEERCRRPPTPSELRDVARERRRPKDPNFDHDHAPRWASYAEGMTSWGLDVPEPNPRPPPARKPVGEREAELRERLLGPGGLCRDDALFYRESIGPAVVRCAMGLGLSPTEIAGFTRRFENSDDLTLERKVGGEESRHDLFSTQVIKAKEAFIVDTARSKATGCAPAPSAGAILAAIRASPVPLDGEQVQAVVAACSRSGWCVWDGWAGTGKSTALGAVVDAYRGRSSGEGSVADHVLALSTAAMTAQETARKIGADRGATIEALVGAVERGKLKLSERSVLIVDEYVMLDTFRAAELLRVAGDARIVCVGDPRQLQGIGASGWQADVEAALVPLARGALQLTHVHRQRDVADREMLAAQRTGDAAGALANLGARGRLHVAGTPEEADGAVLGAYRRLRDEGRAVGEVFVNTDTSNARVDTYNRLIQDDRLRRGEIAGAHLEYRSTNAARDERLYVGDRVALVKGITDGTRRVANGRNGIIERIDHERRRVLVRLDDGTAVKVHIPVSAPLVALRLAYAGHATRTQGSEAPIVLVVPGSGTTSLESGYSSLSRGKEEIHVFADTTTHGPDPAGHLAKRWQRPDPKRSATARSRERTADGAGAGAGRDKPTRRGAKRSARVSATPATRAATGAKKRRSQLISARLAKARAALVSGRPREPEAKRRAASGKASAAPRASAQRIKRIRLVPAGMARVRSLKAKLQASDRSGPKALGVERKDSAEPTRRRSRPSRDIDRDGPDLGGL